MPHDVTMPQLGMAQDAGKIVSWLKSPGDPVAKGDALFEVETDKATMEVEAQASGFLTHVTAGAGEDVPVGQAIARISETADTADDPAAPAAAPSDSLPEGRQITMPQLGMAQDSGVLVGWRVELGAKVSADDTLFEVETDKATMDVPAGASGYLAATLAEPGEDVPVGHAVAVISAERPEAPVAHSVTAAAPAKPSTLAAGPPKPAPAPKPSAPAPAATTGNRVLASPKLRRIALEKGLDLALLVQAGHPQPFHMRDLDALESLSASSPVTTPGAAPSAALRLEATCLHDGFATFAAWAAEARGLKNADALLAGLAGASLCDTTSIAIERFGAQHVFDVPTGRSLSSVTETVAAPDLVIRDLRASPIASVAMGAEQTPVLTLLRQGDGMLLVLECSPTQMAAPRAIAFLSEFAGRMHDPLRHLL